MKKIIDFYGLDYTYYDHPGKYSLILYSGGCNLRCFGCHNRQIAGWDYDNYELGMLNGEGVCKSKIDKKTVNVNECYRKLTDDELKLAIQNDMIDMVIFCGGEFLIYSVEKIKQTIEWVKELNPNVLIRVDTNGTFPEKVKELIEWGKIDGFAIDIKGPYWNHDYHDKISDVIGWTTQVSTKLFPRMVESINHVKHLDHTLFRTVRYPIVDEERYFEEIRSYVYQNLGKPHHFASFVNL